MIKKERYPSSKIKQLRQDLKKCQQQNKSDLSLIESMNRYISLLEAVIASQAERIKDLLRHLHGTQE